MVAEEIVVSLSGGAPWGFRLQGGTEHQKPLQVAKVRRRSKACRAGLKEQDELVAIGDQMCAELSHAQAMNLIDTESSTLNLRVKRSSPGFHFLNYSSGSVSPRSSIRVLPSSGISINTPFLSHTELPRGVTSPPDSEAYYGETDSDADTQSHTQQRRPRRTPPHARSPLRHDNPEEETSEMSGYESAPDAGNTVQEHWNAQYLPGVPRRELVCLPLQAEWTTSTHTPHTLTPHTLTPTPDQNNLDAEEGDSGFQEAGGCTMQTCPPLVSPDRAKEVLRMSSGSHLVPMVGPQQVPVSEELSNTYMDKARQAKLQRGDSVVEKQVKEARTKCRSIASLLTDAPNPNSKGVLMFKKRRQRAKKYTLTCFGKAEGDQGAETEGETGGETEEEGGSSILSGSEVDEQGFSNSFDATWDSGYLDLLDRRSSACPSTIPTTPTTPTANHSFDLDISVYQTPRPVISENQSLALKVSELGNSTNHGSTLESSVSKQPTFNHSGLMSPPAGALTNGGAVSRANVVLSPPSHTPTQTPKGQHGNSNSTPKPEFSPNRSTDCNANVLNRTARPFTPGSTPSRASVTSVMFRPPQPKPTPITTATKPVAAVSMVTIQPSHHQARADARRAVSSTSLYIPPRNNNLSTPSSVSSPPSAFSPPPSLLSTPFPQTPANLQIPASPSTLLSSSAVQAPFTQYQSPPSPYPSPSASILASSFSPPCPPTDSVQISPTIHAYVGTGAGTPGPLLQGSIPDSVVTRDQRVSVPAARTGILSDARHRSNKKPMFSALKSKDVSPNPDLMSIIQNIDDRFGRCAGTAPTGEAGHESGPEEDWLRLGAEACNFMQAQRGSRPPPVAPKPQGPQVPHLEGKGGQLFARRQNRMDRYVVERSPSVAAAPYSPAQTREPSPTPSLPSAWKYSPNIRAPPPINYNPLVSPSCPPKAQKKTEVAKSGMSRSKTQKTSIKPVDIMSHQPYQLNSSLFSYGGGLPQDTAGQHQQQRGKTSSPQKTARVYEVKLFSTPPPTASGPALKVIVPRSATTLGEPLRRSAAMSPPLTDASIPYQQPQSHPQYTQPQWVPPAPTAPLPKLPNLSEATKPDQLPTFSHLQLSDHQQANRQFKSAPDLSPVGPTGAPQTTRVPRPRFSTSSLGLQPCVWRPGSTMH